MKRCVNYRYWIDFNAILMDSIRTSEAHCFFEFLNFTLQHYPEHIQIRLKAVDSFLLSRLY